MYVFELVGRTENDPIYQTLQESNRWRQYDFLYAIISTSLAINRSQISTALIQALNYHAVVGLHETAGKYRKIPVVIRNPDGSIRCEPPEHYRIKGLMDDFVNTVNRQWDKVDVISMTAFVLWRLNQIHPFINGNGRTARALCYFVLCAKLNGLLPGKITLPDLILQNQQRYWDAMAAADSGDFSPTNQLITELVSQQLMSA